MQKKKMCKAAIALSIVFGVSILLSVSGCGKGSVKNVILIIPDGMGISNANLGRWYQDGKPLNADKILCGQVRTYSANSLVTDSAASGSAYSTGHKIDSETVAIMPKDVTNPFIDQTKPDEVNKPLPTILEAARLAGKATGLVVKSELTDATPTTFAAHIDNRDLAEPIAEQIANNGVDVILGGGRAYFVPGEEEINRTDGENLVDMMKNNGYSIVTNRDELMAVQEGKVCGFFNDEALDGYIDRDPKIQPSLAEMTQKAIEILSKDNDGFFLMVEASEIDWYGHDNDPIGIATEVLEWDGAVKAALDFAIEDGNTAVISCADHSTGGMYLQSYDSMTELNAVLHKAKHTSYSITRYDKRRTYEYRASNGRSVRFG